MRPPALVLAALLGCDAGDDCGDGAPDVGALCYPDEAIVRVGHGLAPEALAVADFDRDGAADLAMTSPSRQTLAIAWGPAHDRVTAWSLGETPAGLAHADLDGDGHRDLAAALPAIDAVAVLHGRGGREFTGPLRRAAGPAPRALAAADLDADGVAELLTANLGDDTLGVLRRGRAPVAVPVGPGPHALAAGDLDGDGHLDVAVALADAAAVQVLRGTGDGGLLPGARHPVGAAPRALVAGDLDGDGALDLASAGPLADAVDVVFGDGAGDARETRTWPVPAAPAALALLRDGPRPVLGVMSEQTSELSRLDPRTGDVAAAAPLARASALAAGDLDRDGREELVYAAAATGDLGVLAPAPFADLRPAPAWRAPVGGDALAAVDLDGDGLDEIVVFDRGDATVLRGADGVPLGPPTRLDPLATVRRTYAADLDGDGRRELLAWNEARLAVLSLGADAALAPLATLELPGSYLLDAIAGDLGGDGRVDLVVATRSGADPTRAALHAWTGDGAGGFGVAAPLAVADVGDRLTPADLDGDAALDVVTARDDALALFPDLAPGASPSTLYPLPGATLARVARLDDDAELDALTCGPPGVTRVLRVTSPAVMQTAPVTSRRCDELSILDLDGDGDLDALALALDDGDPDVVTAQALHNDGAGGLVAGARVRVGAHAAVARLDADPRPDLVHVDERETGALRGALGPGLLERPGASHPRGHAGRFADLDGDGLADRVVFAPGLAFAHARGDGRFDAWHHLPLADAADPDVRALSAVDAADLDGDGVDELFTLGAVQGAAPLFSVSRLRVARDGATTRTPVTRIGGAPPTWLRVRDLDDDGRPDLLLAGIAGVALNLAVLRGVDGGGGGFAAPLTQRHDFAAVGRIQGLADGDGDGRLDLVLVDDSGTWLVRGDGRGNFDAPYLWGGPRRRSNPVSGPWFSVVGDHLVDLLALVDRRPVRFMGDGRGRAGARTLRLGPDADALALADLDGDGADELLLATANVADLPALLYTGRPLGDGRFALRLRELPASAATGAVLDLAAARIDADDALDVVVVDARGFTVVRQRP
jgi:hypothetical protein